MKKILFTLTAVFLLAVLCRAEEIPTYISRVVVYEDRAMVTRNGETSLPAGPGEIVLSGLPAIIMDDSVRVSGQSSGQVTISGTEIRRSFLTNPRRNEVKNLEDRIRDLKEEMATLNDELRSMEMEINFISSIQSSVPEKISNEMLLSTPDPAKWEKVLNFISQSSSDVYTRERKVRKEKNELNKKISALEKELKQIQSFISREAKEIMVSVEAAEPASLKLEISYVIPGATWRPVYDIRAQHKQNSAELTYRAEVRQRSGENWDDVKIALSTARPSIGGRPAELSPWYIDIYTPPTIRRREAYSLAKSAIPAAPMEMAEEGEVISENEIDLIFDKAETARAGAAVTFEIPRKQSIPSDGAFHGIPVDKSKIKADYSYITVPKLVEFAYLMAGCENVADYPLLGGKINLFLGPDFVGTSHLDSVAPGEKYDIYLGIDEDIKVKRELISEKTEKGGLFSSKTGYRNYNYRITLENFHKDSQKVIVLDQIPVSKSSDITVEPGDITPATVKIPKWEQPGVLSWKVELPPRVKKSITFEFTIEFPRDKKISGL